MGKRRKKENMLKTSLCLLWLILPSLVSTGLDCGKDERCHLMYCGDTCGKMVFMEPNNTCIQCSAGEYLNDIHCQCMSCEGTYTNSVPNIRYYCQDSREERSTSTARTQTITTSKMPTPRTSSSEKATILPPRSATTMTYTRPTASQTQAMSTMSAAEKSENATTPFTEPSKTDAPSSGVSPLVIVAAVIAAAVIAVLLVILIAWWCFVKPRRNVANRGQQGPNGRNELNQMLLTNGTHERVMEAETTV